MCSCAGGGLRTGVMVGSAADGAVAVCAGPRCQSVACSDVDRSA